ncbi:kxDL motif-containing protein CG10681-like protein [Dinothrombium tinctorium]|uniref:KxDL motif-containing protein CG10681-like protein n=1 Tax=Dinothrombium tinctorium TaxID=1965070 RepID=A0A3S3Q3A8_9ACAR|nr:kxDL motif-containing protein CG10681-like protein [Dinothrombium tinctorium]RWS13160.1 kxDL motif-containing protein CG10681-like protein [Dinothrombium tinctorium]RWS13608.1 kxDL motif-containing protein CG10681-like protein [Dinothrombium tinctorium]
MSEDNNGENAINPNLIPTLMKLIDKEDVEEIVNSQKLMLLRFEKTNEMLGNCNALALSRFEMTSKVLKRYTQQLIEMKKDLDSIYRRIRFLKMRLSQVYPDAFHACSNRFNIVEEEDEEMRDDKHKRNVT